MAKIDVVLLRGDTLYLKENINGQLACSGVYTIRRTDLGVDDIKEYWNIYAPTHYLIHRYTTKKEALENATGDYKMAFEYYTSHPTIQEKHIKDYEKLKASEGKTLPLKNSD